MKLWDWLVCLLWPTQATIVLGDGWRLIVAGRMQRNGVWKTALFVVQPKRKSRCGLMLPRSVAAWQGPMSVN